MIVPQQMQHAVEHQNLDLNFQLMTEFGRLPGGRLRRYGNVTQSAATAGNRKREHVGGCVFTAKLAVQAPQVPVAGEEAAEWLSGRGLLTKLPGKIANQIPAQARRSPAEDNCRARFHYAFPEFEGSGAGTVGGVAAGSAAGSASLKLICLLPVSASWRSYALTIRWTSGLRTTSLWSK